MPVCPPCGVAFRSETHHCEPAGGHFAARRITMAALIAAASVPVLFVLLGRFQADALGLAFIFTIFAYGMTLLVAIPALLWLNKKQQLTLPKALFLGAVCGGLAALGLIASGEGSANGKYTEAIEFLLVLLTAGAMVGLVNATAFWLLLTRQARHR